MFYVYDRTFEGFLSAVTIIMRDDRVVQCGLKTAKPFYGIVRENSCIPLLDCYTVSNIPDIVNDFGEYINHNFGELMTKTIYHAYLSEIEGIENAIFDYILLARKQRKDPADQLYTDCVKKVVGAAKKVTRESHHYLGLLRFRKKSLKHSDYIEDNIYDLSKEISSGLSRANISSELSKNHDENKQNSRSNDLSLEISSELSKTHHENKQNNRSADLSKVIYSDLSITHHGSILNIMLDDLSKDINSDLPLKILNEPKCSVYTSPISSVSEIFIAECEPITCSLPLIAEHFVDRFPNQFFIILDKKRKICVMHFPGENWDLVPYDPELEISLIFDNEFESIWQKYFKVLAIPERINPKLQSGNMPKRYWKYLVEKPGK